MSERTIYRDIMALSLSGVPVQGEAGCGYRLLPGFDCPPLMLTPMEVEAMVAALRILRTWGGPQISQAADSAEEKLLGILSPQRRMVARRSRVLAPEPGQNDAARLWSDIAHSAVMTLQVVEVLYCDVKRRVTRREVNPLGLAFWGERWLMVGWCELRGDYRSFRLDRLQEVRVTGQCFTERADRSLQDFLRIQNEKRELSLLLSASEEDQKL